MILNSEDTTPILSLVVLPEEPNSGQAVSIELCEGDWARLCKAT